MGNRGLASLGRDVLRGHNARPDTAFSRRSPRTVALNLRQLPECCGSTRTGGVDRLSRDGPKGDVGGTGRRLIGCKNAQSDEIPTTGARRVCAAQGRYGGTAGMATHQAGAAASSAEMKTRRRKDDEAQAPQGANGYTSSWFDRSRPPKSTRPADPRAPRGA
jgi:hypothetical protein